MRPPSLESERLVYKPLGMVHLTEKYLSWLNDRAVNRFTFSKLDNTMPQLRKYLEHVVENPILFWALHLKDTDEHVGNIKIDPIHFDHLYGEYGILIGEKRVWGKGLGKEASRVVINYCFEHLGLRKINLHVSVKNEVAIKMYFDIGFKLEGILRSHFKYNYGFDDVYRMAIFNPNVSWE